MEHSITAGGGSGRTGGFAHYALKAAQWLTLLIPILVFTGKAPVDIACSLVGVLFLATHAVQRDFGWLRHTWVRLMLLFWAYLLLRACFSEDPALALDRAAPWVRYPFFAIALGHWVIMDRAFSRRLLISVGIGCAMLSADALFQFVTGKDILGYAKANAERLTGPYRRPRIGHTIAWLAMPLLVCCLCFDRKAPVLSLLKLAGGALVFLAVLVSGERSPTLLLVMGLGLTALLLPAIRRKLVWLVPLAALGIAALLYLNPVLYKRQIVSTGTTIANFWETPYGQIALDSRDFIVEAPVFGIGVQHYRVATARGTDARAQGHSHPHNFYLEILVETGMVGLALLVLMFGYWVLRIVREYPLWLGDGLATGLAIGILIRLWPVISIPSFYASWNVIPLWLMVGWYFALMRLKQTA